MPSAAALCWSSCRRRRRSWSAWAKSTAAEGAPVAAPKRKESRSRSSPVPRPPSAQASCLEVHPQQKCRGDPLQSYLMRSVSGGSQGSHGMRQGQTRGQHGSEQVELQRRIFGRCVPVPAPAVCAGGPSGSGWTRSGQPRPQQQGGTKEQCTRQDRGSRGIRSGCPSDKFTRPEAGAKHQRCPDGQDRPSRRGQQQRADGVGSHGGTEAESQQRQPAEQGGRRLGPASAVRRPALPSSRSCRCRA